MLSTFALTEHYLSISNKYDKIDLSLSHKLEAQCTMLETWFWRKDPVLKTTRLFLNKKSRLILVLMANYSLLIYDVSFHSSYYYSLLLTYLLCILILCYNSQQVNIKIHWSKSVSAKALKVAKGNYRISTNNVKVFTWL